MSKTKPAPYASKFADAIRGPGDLLSRMRSSLRWASLGLASSLQSTNSQPGIRFLYFHYVFDDQRDAFRAQIVALQKLGTFISTERALQMIHANEICDRRYFCLSADDGFANVLSNAWVILQSLNVPLTFFVPTDFIDASYERVRQYSVEISHHKMAIEVASWAGLRTAAAEGLEIGSHTQSHVRLSSVSSDAERLQHEIAGSKQLLEDQIGRPVRYFSMPFGSQGDYDDMAQQCVINAGYEACFSAERGPVILGKASIYNLPREHFEPEWPLSHVRYFALGGLSAKR